MTPKQKEQQVKLLDQCYRSKLSKKAFGQLKKAVSTPRNEFWSKLLAPNLILDAEGRPIFDVEGPSLYPIVDRLSRIDLDPEELMLRPSYICVSDKIHVERRNQQPTLSMFEDFEGDIDLLRLPPRRQTYFTNTMRFWNAKQDAFEMPSERCVFGAITVLTIEFDPPKDWSTPERLIVLEEQLDWLRRSGNERHSQKVQKIIRWAKRFADFRGLCVVYSGDKSLHFHFAFDTSALCETHPSLRDHLRPAYAAAHDKLVEAFEELLPLNGLEPDTGMRQPEQFRRLPNGMRLVKDSKRHLFGVPSGRRINQSVLYEEVLAQAPKGSKTFLFDEIKVNQAREVTASQRRSKRSREGFISSWVNDEEQAYCLDGVDKLFRQLVGHDEYPRVSHFETSGQGLVLKLFANADDANPGGVLFAGSNRPIFAGGKTPKQNPSIGLPLQHHIKQLRREWRKLNPNVGSDTTDDINTVHVLRADLNASDVVTSRSKFEHALRGATADNAVVMVKGPAGFGKTTAMMRVLPDLVTATKHNLIKARESAPIYELDLIKGAVSAVATSGYEQAVDKCNQFNQMHQSCAAIGLVFKSFDRLYCAALEAVFGEGWQREKVFADMAARGRSSSVLGAIRMRQPKVWEQMVQLHQEMLQPLRTAPAGCAVVLFMVHDVLHQWTEGGLSRLLSHPNFFQTDVSELWRLEEQTKLIVAVQDEIALKHLIRLKDLRHVEWCERLFADKPSIWNDKHIHLGDAHEHWEKHCGKSLGSVSFDEVLIIKRTGISSESIAGVGALEPYGQSHDGKTWEMYAPSQQMNFAFQKRSWWRGLAHHTVILTAETLPVTLFEISERDQPCTTILSLSEGLHPDGVVELHVVGNMSSDTNAQIANQIREHEADLDLFVIANKCAALERSTPHVSAKGVNHLADENILQLINWVSRTEYAKLQAVNMVFGMKSAIRLHHIDQFNQTVGRNLGYRYVGKRHIVYVPSALWRHMADGTWHDFAFQIDQIEDAPHRRDKRKTRDRQIACVLERDEVGEANYGAENCLDMVMDQQAEAAFVLDDMDLDDNDVFPSDAVIDAAYDQMLPEQFHFVV